MGTNWRELVHHILQRRLVPREELAKALQGMRPTSIAIESAILEWTGIEKSELLALKREIYDCATIDLATFSVDLEAANLLPRGMAERYETVCVARLVEHEQLVLASAYPLDGITRSYIASRCGAEVREVLTCAADLDDAWDKVYNAAVQAPVPAALHFARMQIPTEVARSRPRLVRLQAV